MNCARGNDLAGEIIACLRVNLLRGTLTTQDEHGRCDLSKRGSRKTAANHETQNRRN